MCSKILYTSEPENEKEFTENFNKFYSKYAFFYNVFTKMFPTWKSWLKRAIPHIKGPRVLEISFGPGYLLTKYADKFDTYGIDYNKKMVEITKKNLKKKRVKATIQQGNVEALPYEDNFFDSIVNTMAFSGYPNGIKALSEIYRVLKKGGKLIIIDINHPFKKSWSGSKMVKFWQSSGDIIRNMGILFEKFNLRYTDAEIGGFGSVHLYIAKK